VSNPIIVLIMGVSGVGKTTVGKALAAKLDWRFVDGDDLHSRGNVTKMSQESPSRTKTVDRGWTPFMRS
jgi:carbohydrate kinase (thermoresistant glucokinase family)